MAAGDIFFALQGVPEALAKALGTVAQQRQRELEAQLLLERLRREAEVSMRERELTTQLALARLAQERELQEREMAMRKELLQMELEAQKQLKAIPSRTIQVVQPMRAKEPLDLSSFLRDLQQGWLAGEVQILKQGKPVTDIREIENIVETYEKTRNLPQGYEIYPAREQRVRQVDPLRIYNTAFSSATFTLAGNKDLYNKVRDFLKKRVGAEVRKYTNDPRRQTQLQLAAKSMVEMLSGLTDMDWIELQRELGEYPNLLQTVATLRTLKTSGYSVGEYIGLEPAQGVGSPRTMPSTDYLQYLEQLGRE